MGEEEDHGLIRDCPQLAGRWASEAPASARPYDLIRYVLDRHSAWRRGRLAPAAAADRDQKARAGRRYPDGSRSGLRPLAEHLSESLTFMTDGRQANAQPTPPDPEIHSTSSA